MVSWTVELGYLAILNKFYCIFHPPLRVCWTNISLSGVRIRAKGRPRAPSRQLQRCPGGMRVISIGPGMSRKSVAEGKKRVQSDHLAVEWRVSPGVTMWRPSDPAFPTISRSLLVKSLHLKLFNGFGRRPRSVVWWAFVEVSDSL